jgi:signal transduction histidine kinase
MKPHSQNQKKKMKDNILQAIEMFILAMKRYGDITMAIEMARFMLDTEEELDEFTKIIETYKRIR